MVLLRWFWNGDRVAQSDRSAKRPAARARPVEWIVDHQTDILRDITVALVLALGGGWIATRLRVSPIIGYIAAGVVISPFTPGFVGDIDRLRLVADIGVVLLLFGIGVEFSLSDLARAGARLIAAALVQTAIVFGGVAGAAVALGLDVDQALYVGAATAISSSVVIVRILQERNESASDHGQAAVSWSIVQDLAAIALILVIGATTGSSEGDRPLAVSAAIAGGIAVAFIGGTLFIGSRVVPPVLERVEREPSRELFFLSVATLAIGTALVAEYAGLSLAIGAFVAGLVVSESDVSHRVLRDLLPTRDVFAVIFFVAAGMLIRPEVVADQWPAILLLTAAIVAAKPAVAWLCLRVAGRDATSSALTAALLVPAAEFSFLIADAGLGDGVLSEDTFGVILTSAVLSVVMAPALVAIVFSRLAVTGPAVGATTTPAS